MSAGKVALGVVIGALLIIGIIAGVGWYYVMGPGDLPLIPFLSSVGPDDAEDALDPVTVIEDSDVLDEYSVQVEHFHYAPRTIHDALCFLYGKTIPFLAHEPHLDNLHVQAWGLDGTTADVLDREYANSFAADGYTLYSSGSTTGIGWQAYEAIYINGNNARSTITADGPSIRANYGRDVVICTGYGLTTEYVSYVAFLSGY